MNNIINLIKNFDTANLTHLIISIIILAIFDIFSPVFSYIILKIFNTKKTSKEIKNMALYIPIKSFFKVTGIYFAIVFLKPILGFSDKFMTIIEKVYKIIITITTATGLANSMTRKSRIVKRIKEKSDREIDDSTTRFMVRGIRILIYIIAAFMIIYECGYDLSWLITGLGLGSVVVTLAAQDVIKSLLGGVFIFTDKPFRIGDYIKFSTYQGTIEDITFRSTKIRTVDNTIVQVPNSLLSSSSVENFSKIEKRRYILNLELVLNTESDKIEKLKKEVYEKLSQNEEILVDTINICLTEIKPNGLNLMVICYINIIDYNLFLQMKEKINYLIMQIVNKNNIELAYDTKTIEIKNKNT